MIDRTTSDTRTETRTIRREDAVTRSAGTGALVAGLASITCCVVPFAFLSLGAGGAWLANLTALAPYQPYFIGAAVLFLGFGLWRIRRQGRTSCDDDGTYCASPASRRFLRISMWVTAVLVIAGIGFNYLGQWLLNA